MKKCIIFDLDDTLYSEYHWVHSGLQHCAELVSERYDLEKDTVFENFIKGFEKRGRGKVFHTSLQELDIDEAEIEDLFQYLFYRYRTHKPRIELYPGVMDVLRQLKAHGCGLGILTDGVLTAQVNKVEALGLNKIMDGIIYTEVFGEEGRKPSILPFTTIKQFFSGDGEYYYVGDYPEKDFEGAKRAGYRTVMISDDHNVKRLEQLTSVQKPDIVLEKFEDLLEVF